MNTLLITLEYPPFYGGVSDYYKNIIKHWPKTSQIFVLNNNKNELVSQKLPFLKWIPSIFAIYNEVKKQKINHIVVGHILPLGTATLLLLKILNIKYSVILHGLDFTMATTNPRKRFISKAILNSAKNIICANSFTETKVRSFIGQNNKITTINPGINTNNNHPIKNNIRNQLIAKHNLKNTYTLLSVGRLVRRKGFDSVIKALPKVIKNAPDLKYFIIGQGEDQQYLTDIISKNYLNKHVFILNNVDHEEKEVWLNLANCFIMVSREIDGDYEGFGIVYLEAGLHELPVIAGNSGGVGDVVKHQINGILTDPESLKGISDSIIELYKNETLRTKLGRKAKTIAINDFKWQDQINKIASEVNK